METETFGKVVREKRKERGLSLRELARRTGVSHPYLSQLENEKNKNPSLEIVIKLSSELDISLSRLLELAGIDTTNYDSEIPTNMLSLMNQLNNKELTDIQKFNEELDETINKVADLNENGDFNNWQKKLKEIKEILPKKIARSKKIEDDLVNILTKKVKANPLITPFSISESNINNEQHQKSHTICFDLPAYKKEAVQGGIMTSYIPPYKALGEFYNIENLLKLNPEMVNFKNRKLSSNDIEKILEKIEEMKDEFEYLD